MTRCSLFEGRSAEKVNSPKINVSFNPKHFRLNVLTTYSLFIVIAFSSKIRRLLSYIYAICLLNWLQSPPPPPPSTSPSPAHPPAPAPPRLMTIFSYALACFRLFSSIFAAAVCPKRSSMWLRLLRLAICRSCAAAKGRSTQNYYISEHRINS